MAVRYGPSNYYDRKADRKISSKTAVNEIGPRMTGKYDWLVEIVLLLPSNHLTIANWQREGQSGLPHIVMINLESCIVFI